MADANNTSMQSKRSPALWTSLIVVAVIVLLVVVYYSQSTDTEGNENSNRNSNTVVNTNAGVNQNTNAISNTNSATNTNASMDSSGWNTYSDATSGLSIQYPTDWVAVDTSYASKGFRPSSTQTAQADWSVVYVTFRSNTQDLQIQQFYEQATDFANLYDRATSNETRTINGVQAVYFGTIPGAVANSALVASSGSWVVELQMHKDQIGVIDDVQSVFFEMISTVK